MGFPNWGRVPDLGKIPTFSLFSANVPNDGFPYCQDYSWHQFRTSWQQYLMSPASYWKVNCGKRRRRTRGEEGEKTIVRSDNNQDWQQITHTDDKCKKNNLTSKIFQLLEWGVQGNICLSLMLTLDSGHQYPIVYSIPSQLAMSCTFSKRMAPICMVLYW